MENVVSFCSLSNVWSPESQVGHIGPTKHMLLQHVSSPMLPGQKPRDEKVIQTIQAIKNCGWRSTNQFVEVFYSSTVAAQSLRYQLGSEYSPERIMSAWMKNVPSEDARQVLNLAITRKAAEIMVKESTPPICNRTYCRLCGHRFWAWEDQENLQHIFAVSYPPSQHSFNGAEWLWKEERCREDRSVKKLCLQWHVFWALLRYLSLKHLFHYLCLPVPWWVPKNLFCNIF